MSETIRDGRGNAGSGAEYIVGVTQDHKLMVDASVSLGSISVAAGSMAIMYGSSGADVGLYPLRVQSGTTAALFVAQTSSTRTISAGSVQIISSAGSVGVWQASTPWAVSGIVQIVENVPVSVIGTADINIASSDIDVPITGNYVDDQPFTAEGDIGLAVGGFATSDGVNAGDFGVFKINTARELIVTGSVAVSSPISVAVGSEVYIKAGSVQTYNPVGIGSIWFGGGIGSVTITNSLPAIGSYTTQTISGTVTVDNRVAGSIVNMPIVGVSGTLFAISGVVNQGTTPWATSGVVNQGTNPWIILGSTQITNPTLIGSVQTQGVSGTAFNTVWLGVGSVLAAGSVAVTNLVMIQGPQADGNPMAGSPVVIAFKDLFGNALIPTGINAAGINVLGTVGIDLNGNLWSFSGGGIGVFGDTPHDGVDAGRPIKVGGTAQDYEPDQDAIPNGSLAEVAEADRAQLTTNRWGQLVEGVNPFYATIGSINTIYQSGIVFTSQAFECWNYRYASFNYELYKSGTPTDIVFEVEQSLDGTNYGVMQNDFLGDIRESAASVTAGTGIKKSLTFPIAAQKIRFKSQATGVSGANHFVVSGARVYLRN